MPGAMREIHTKYLFVALLSNFACDIVLDVGSRDGRESRIFKRALPQAKVVALEANPHNFRGMMQDPDIVASGIEVENLAIWKEDGHVRFNITEVDYDKTSDRWGTSSILEHPDLTPSEVVDAECMRIDTFLASRHSDRQRIAIWIDVEGAEYQVLEGIAGCLNRVVMIHVETATASMYDDQRLFHDVDARLAQFGFQPIGSDFDGRFWGNVLYVKKDAWRRRDRNARRAYVIAWLARAFPRRRIAGFLLRNLPWLHQWLKRRFRTSPLLSGY